MNDYLFQRRTLGILCALLAPACILFGLCGLETNLPNWYMSISATYYANDKMFLIGLLSATAIFFFSYKGYDWRDIIISFVQGVSCIGIIIFPCKTDGIPNLVGLFNLPVSISNTLHCIFSSLLFVAFAINITFLFTISSKNPTKEKQKRNVAYRICGITIFVFIIIQLCTSTFLKGKFGNFPTTWFNEFIMLEAFSVAWLIKGEAIASFNDKKN